MIETDERMVTYITCGNVDYQIVGMSSIEYPDLPTFEQTDIKKKLCTDNNFAFLLDGNINVSCDSDFKIVA